MATRTIRNAWIRIGFLFSLVLSGQVVLAQNSSGFKFNNLTVSPFVNLEYSYDSNVDYDHGKAYDDTILSVNPGVDFDYKGNDWGLSGDVWYGYEKYQDYEELDANRYGQSLKFYSESARGIRFVLGESYLKSKENDSILDGGRGIWRERDMLELDSALAYQISERTGITLNGMYSNLDYENNVDEYGMLYGWSEWSIGLELARKLTEKSNLLVSGNYQEYESKGAIGINNGSTGYSLMAGLGSRATEKISYRALVGMSWFDYAGQDQMNGITYSLDANWLINRKWAMTVAGSSYFQPSETEANQAMQAYVLSAGWTYRTTRRLTTRFDVGFRREENQYDYADVGAVTDDIYSARLRADYKLMRYVTLYGSVEYQDQTSDLSANEYDRYRGTLGLTLRY